LFRSGTAEKLRPQGWRLIGDRAFFVSPDSASDGQSDWFLLTNNAGPGSSPESSDHFSTQDNPGATLFMTGMLWAAVAIVGALTASARF
jgi:hypothetical protein